MGSAARASRSECRPLDRISTPFGFSSTADEVLNGVDLDRRSIAAFVAGWEGPLHILVNNAGIMALPSLERTSAGWEMQFTTNFLGHFALTVGLHDDDLADLPKERPAAFSTLEPDHDNRSRYRNGDFIRLSRVGDLVAVR